MTFMKQLKIFRSIFILIVVCLLNIQCSQNEKYDIVVIGGGLMGSSVAWQLSKSGQEVLLIEKQSRNYDQGSSNGEARIARSLGPEDDIWSSLHNINVSEVEELIQFLNSREDSEHKMEDVFTTSPVSYVRHLKQIKRIERLATPSQKDSFKFARNPREARTLFDAELADTAIMIREYKPYSGTINPKALIEKLHKGIRFFENEIWYDTKVDQLRKTEHGFEMTILEGEKPNRKIQAHKVISAAGPYTGILLKDVAPYFDSLITPQRVFLAFLKVRQNKWDDLSNRHKQKLTDGYPVINSSRGTRSTGFFSMIERWEENRPILKIGGHFQREDIQSLDQVWYKGITEEEAVWAIESTVHYLNQLDLPIAKNDLEISEEYSCVYSLSRTEVPYVTNAILNNGEVDQNLVMMGAMSGVGAKGALAYGKLAADIVLNQLDQLGPLKQAYEKMGPKRLRSDIAKLRK